MSFLTLGHSFLLFSRICSSVQTEQLVLMWAKVSLVHPVFIAPPHTWTSIVQGTITCDKRIQTKKYFFVKIHEYKNQTNRMHSCDPVFEASLQLVGDSNRKETSCEWEGPAINTGGCQLPKNYYLWIENQNLQGKCIRCLLKTDFDVVAEAYLKKSALPVPMYTSCICTSKAQEMRPNLEVGQRRLEPWEEPWETMGLGLHPPLHGHEVPPASKTQIHQSECELNWNQRLPQPIKVFCLPDYVLIIAINHIDWFRDQRDTFVSKENMSPLPLGGEVSWHLLASNGWRHRRHHGGPMAPTAMPGSTGAHQTPNHCLW